MPEPRFRRDLFQGTAEYYERFRPRYPSALFDDLRARAPLGADARVLDLACGTGQIAFDLAHNVANAFEADVRRQLLASCPDGVFEQEQTSAYELARRAS